MLRIAVPAVLASIMFVAVATCSKSAKNQDPGPAAGPAPTKVEVPGATRGGPVETAGPAGTQQGDAFRLKPDEGQLAIQLAGEPKAGQEMVANIVVTPGPNYKINFEYPTKLTLQSPTGVTLAKAEMKAGGADKVKGDAEAFEERKLAFAVKLVPSASGSYTINGSFKFAVCDKDQCLAKKEPIAIQVAAK